MSDITNHPQVYRSTDEVLQEIWRIKDEMSAYYGHDLKRFCADMREGEKHSGHKVVNLQRKPKIEEEVRRVEPRRGKAVSSRRTPGPGKKSA